MTETKRTKTNGVSRPEKLWQRNLYTKTGLPDNYTPADCFLAAIERNKNPRVYELAEVEVAAGSVAMQICAVVLFYLAYTSLKVIYFFLPARK